MVRTRSQLENISKEELIDELISVEDISSKLSDPTSPFDDFLRQYEVLSSELAVSKNSIHLLTEKNCSVGPCGACDHLKKKDTVKVKFKCTKQKRCMLIKRKNLRTVINFFWQALRLGQHELSHLSYKCTQL